MRFLWLLVPLVLVLTGCGPAPKTYSKPVAPPTFDGKSLGNGIFYYTKEDLLKVATNNYKYLSNADDVKKLLLDVGFVKKEGNLFKLTKLDALNYTLNEDLKKLNIESFEYNKEKKEYLLSGRYVYSNVIFAEGKTNRWDWPVRFIALYDEATQEIKGMYYNTYDKFNQVILSEAGKAAWFSSYHGGDFLNLDTNKTSALKQVPFYTFDSTRYQFSKNGKYFAKQLNDTKKDGKDLGILLYDLQEGRTLFNQTFYYSDYASFNLGFSFSEDEKYFIYKTKESNFKVYDLTSKTEIGSFGNNTAYNNDWVNITSSENFVFGYLSAYEKDKPSIYKLYVYDTQKREVFCQMDEDIIFPSRVVVYKDTFNALYADGVQMVYNLEKDNCYKIKEYSNLGSIMTQNRPVKKFIKDDAVYFFENGVISKQQMMIKPEITEEEKQSVLKLNKIKKYIRAGFEQKGLEMLQDLILNDEYDFFAKQYTNTTNFLSGFQEAYVNLLAFRRYIAKGVRDSEFERSVRNYIFFASRYGFKDLIPPFIDEYVKAIGETPSKDQLDKLALYKATYLLDINKDTEAYELLFEHAPFSKEAKDMVKRFTSWNTGLMKDRKKLAVILEIKESELREPEKKITSVNSFYDLNGNLVQKGEKPKEVIEEKKEVVSPKQEAIKLLD
jgi:hypothetical protein